MQLLFPHLVQQGVENLAELCQELKGQENKQTIPKEPFSYGALENSAFKTECCLAQTSLSAVKGRSHGD